MENEELKQAIAEVAASAGTASRNGHSAMAELIVEMVEPNNLTLDIFNSFMPVTQLNAGDSIMKKVQKGRYPVRTMVPGSKHLTDATYVKDKTQFMFDSIIAGTKHNLWEIQSGDVGTVQEMRTDLRNEIINNIVARVFGLLTTVWNGIDTPRNFIDASSGGITANDLDTAIEEVLERAGGVRAIVGSRRALYPMYNFMTTSLQVVEAGASGTAIPTPRFDEFWNNNRLLTYKGIPIVEMGQVFSEALPDVREKLIRTDTVLVIGEDAGRIALLDEFQYQDYTDMTVQPADYVLHGWQQYALLVDQIDRIAVLKSNT